MALLITVVQMIRAGIVEIDRLLDGTKPEGAGIELKVRGGISRNRSDMMDAGNACCSRGLLLPRFELGTEFPLERGLAATTTRKMGLHHQRGRECIGLRYRLTVGVAWTKSAKCQ
jgi:hypothetical protein